MTLAMKFQEKYAEGKEEGREEGLLEGEAKGKIIMLAELVNEKVFTEEEAARRAGMSVSEFKKYME